MKKERGSVYLMVVLGMAMIIIMMIMGIITINTNEISSSVQKSRQKFLQETQVSIASWYRRNSADTRLWDPSTTLQGCPGGICDDVNNVFLNEVGIQNKHGVRFFVTDVFQTYTGSPPDPLSKEFHSNVIFRRIYFVVGDGNTDPMDGIIFSPAQAGMIDWSNPASVSGATPSFSVKPGYEGRVFFGYVDGKRIQDENIAKTLDVLLTMARLLESRFKAKLELDAFHDIGTNYFRALNCYSRISAEELPCTELISPVLSGRNDSTGSTQTAIYLGFREIYDGGGFAGNINTMLGTLTWAFGSGIPQSDAWGNPILLSNSPASGASVRPPFSMLVSSVTPWGTWLVVNAIQPVN